MANIKSAKKRISVIERKTARNKRVKNHVKEAIKAFEVALEAKDFSLAEEKLVFSEKKLMQAAAKGVFHKKMAARKVSRLQQKFNKAKA